LLTSADQKLVLKAIDYLKMSLDYLFSTEEKDALFQGKIFIIM